MGRTTARASVNQRAGAQEPSSGSYEEVARIAYELFERRGGVHGHDLEDWVEAERLVRARRRDAPRFPSGDRRGSR